MNLQHGSWPEHVLLFLGAWFALAIIVVSVFPLIGWLYSILHSEDDNDNRY